MYPSGFKPARGNEQRLLTSLPDPIQPEGFTVSPPAHFLAHLFFPPSYLELTHLGHFVSQKISSGLPAFFHPNHSPLSPLDPTFYNTVNPLKSPLWLPESLQNKVQVTTPHLSIASLVPPGSSNLNVYKIQCICDINNRSSDPSQALPPAWGGLK